MLISVALVTAINCSSVESTPFNTGFFAGTDTKYEIMKRGKNCNHFLVFLLSKIQESQNIGEQTSTNDESLTFQHF